jgi:diacylglycerol kinase family enzyme
VGYLLIHNPRSGSDTRPILDLARSRLRDCRTVELGGVDLATAIEEAVAEDRVVIAAGGDGTVSAAAQHLVERGTLGVLPLGTLNHFARDLGIDGPEAALDALTGGREIRIDVGRAGGRVFVNNTGMGIYPELVRERERRQEGIGKRMAAVAAAASAMRRADPLVGTIEADGDARALLAWMVFVGNNVFGTEPGRIGTRSRLDRGVLDLRILTLGRRRARRSSVAWRILRGREWKSRRLVRREARRVVVSLEGGPRLISRDGESGDSATRLEVEILPRALRVLVPAPSR